MALSPADLQQIETLFSTLLAEAKIKISELPAMGAIPRTTVMPTVAAGSTQKMSLVQLLGLGITTVPVGQDLRAMDTDQIEDGTLFHTTGVVAADDGGEGDWLYDANSVAADNIGTVIAPDSGVGRFLRQYTGPIQVPWFGDDRDAIQAAFDAAAGFESAAVEFPNSAAYLVAGGGLTLNTNRVHVIGNGAILTFSATTGVALDIENDNADLTYRLGLNRAHPVTDLILKGPGSGTGTGIRIEDSVTNSIAGVTFSGVDVLAFQTLVELSDGAFLISFENGLFGHLANFVNAVGIYLPAATNAGERNTFTNCDFNSVTMTALVVENGDSSTFFTNCSFDYCKRFMTVEGGVVQAIGCHFENNLDTDYWFHVSTSFSSFVNIIGGEIVITANKTNFVPFYVGPECTQGGLSWTNSQFGSISTLPGPMADGGGRLVVSNIATFFGSTLYAIGEGANQLAYGGFENANYEDDWTFTGPNPPVRSNVLARTGTYSLSFPGTVGDIPRADFDRVCQPGQYFTGELWYQVAGITGTSGTFFISYSYVDGGGNTISGATILARTTDNGTWTRVNFSNNVPAPKGTRTVKLTVDIFGIASGTPTAYIDDVVINIF